ncbi:MAG: MATE family efflux transporter [Oscillospiraceae bacterium]|nr:MATE family efflux transporter [Oscillospiraceae bacterium]
MALDMTKGREWKHLLLFSLPLMAGQLLQQLYNTVDGVVVGNYINSGALAAVGGCMPLAMAFLALAGGMSNGSGVVIAQYFGAGKKPEMRKAASTALVMLFFLGLLLTVAGAASSKFIMTYVLSISEKDIREYATVYFAIYSSGLIFQFIYNCVAGILRSVGDSRATLYFLCVSTAVNIVLDLVFVIIFHWGVAGTAVATVLAQAACSAASVLYMFKRYPDFRFRLSELKFYGLMARQCVRMGIPTTIQQLVVSCGHVVLQRLVNTFGSVTMAAYTVGSRFDHYMSVPCMGITSAMTSFTGQNTGAGRPDRIKKGISAALILNFTLVTVLCIILYIFARQCAALFGVEGETMTQSVEYLRFITIIYPLFSLYIPFSGLFNGAGNPVASMVSSFMALSLKVAGAYVMVYVLGMGYASCWQSNIIGWVAALVYVLIHYFRGRWKNRGVAGQPGECA